MNWMEEECGQITAAATCTRTEELLTQHSKTPRAEATHYIQDAKP
jgi:hypothetical protein